MIEHYIRGFEEELREIRHQIHENPELGLQEFKTSALVAEKLRQWGYEVEQGLATTGVVATLKVGDGEKSIGLIRQTKTQKGTERLFVNTNNRSPGINNVHRDQPNNSASKDGSGESINTIAFPGKIDGHEIKG